MKRVKQSIVAFSLLALLATGSAEGGWGWRTYAMAGTMVGVSAYVAYRLYVAHRKTTSTAPVRKNRDEAPQKQAYNIGKYETLTNNVGDEAFKTWYESLNMQRSGLPWSCLALHYLTASSTDGSPNPNPTDSAAQGSCELLNTIWQTQCEGKKPILPFNYNINLLKCAFKNMAWRLEMHKPENQTNITVKDVCKHVDCLFKNAKQTPTKK